MKNKREKYFRNKREYTINGGNRFHIKMHEIKCERHICGWLEEWVERQLQRPPHRNRDAFLSSSNVIQGEPIKLVARLAKAPSIEPLIDRISL